MWRPQARLPGSYIHTIFPRPNSPNSSFLTTTKQSCPPLSEPATLLTRITRTVTPKPSATPGLPKNEICGGGRGNYRQCKDGWTCIKDPFKDGCGPECDGFGICVRDKLCGGFAGFSCPEKGQICVDDYRDDCDPKKGGADCGGLCMWPSTPWE